MKVDPVRPQQLGGYAISVIKLKNISKDFGKGISKVRC